jgi:hypothetical protein
MEERKVLHEITPLMGKDVLYIADRHKKEFTYPIHNHEVFELNFVEHAPGVRRIVGDSSEVIGEYELVLITSPDLEHVWEQHECKSQDIREITVHFDISMDEDSLFGKTPFTSLRKMMNEQKIPAEQRGKTLLLCSQSTVIWCMGVGFSAQGEQLRKTAELKIETSKATGGNYAQDYN